MLKQVLCCLVMLDRLASQTRVYLSSCAPTSSFGGNRQRLRCVSGGGVSRRAELGGSENGLRGGFVQHWGGTHADPLLAYAAVLGYDALMDRMRLYITILHQQNHLE